LGDKYWRFLFKILQFLQKCDHILVFLKKKSLFKPKIGENRDRNIELKNNLPFSLNLSSHLTARYEHVREEGLLEALFLLLFIRTPLVAECQAIPSGRGFYHVS
jgi:hypothetical protein